MNRKKSVPLFRTQLVLIPVLIVVGLGFSGFLSWQSMQSSGIAGCGSNEVFDCEHVISSPWSKVLGAPVAMLAFFTYAAMLGSFVSGVVSRQSHIQVLLASLTRCLAFSAGFAALWFISLQAFVLHHFCIYCLVAHACGLGLGGLALFQGDQPFIRKIIFSAGPALAAIVALATLQVLVPGRSYVIEEVTTSLLASGEEVEPMLVSPFDDFELDTAESAKLNPSSSESQASESSNDKSLAIGYEPINVEAKESIGELPFMLMLTRMSAVSGGLLMYEGNKPALDKEPVKQGDRSRIPADGKMITILNGSMQLNSLHWPIIGKTDAKYMVVELFDYTCPHCRQLSKTLEKAAKIYGDDFAILALPVPMNSRCNASVQVDHAMHTEACELAKIAISVWLASPESFSDFHHWLMLEGTTRTAQAARQKAIQLVGQAKFDQQMNSRKPEKYLSTILGICQRAGSGTIPKLVFPKATVSGNVNSIEDMKRLIQNNFAGK